MVIIYTTSKQSPNYHFKSPSFVSDNYKLSRDKWGGKKKRKTRQQVSSVESAEDSKRNVDFLPHFVY